MMASVCNSAASRYRYKTDDYQTGVSQNVQTVQEKILQQCLNRFYSASCQLQSYQDQRQKFVAAGSSKEASDHAAISGLVDHDAFKAHLQKTEVQKVLQETGLTKHEIEVLLQETSETTRSSKLDLPEDVATASQLITLNAVLQKLSKREIALSTKDSAHPQNFAGAVELSRLEVEDAFRQGALNRNPNEVLSSVATSALIKRRTHPQPAVHPQHPLNHLAALEQELFAGRDCSENKRESSGKSSICSTKRRKVLHCEDHTIDNYENSSCEAFELGAPSSEHKNLKLINEQSSEIDKILYSESHNLGSLWDVKEIPRNTVQNNSIYNAERKVVESHCNNSCSLELPIQKSSQVKKKKDFSKGFVSLPNTQNLVPLSDISSKCIPLSQLLTEFPNYLSGSPSKTLYLKNLSHQTTPEELVNLFGHFDLGCDRVVYRLLQGKMRGQAFVKFPTLDTAQKALRACLGYMLRGKPLVIEFGREKCSS